MKGTEGSCELGQVEENGDKMFPSVQTIQVFTTATGKNNNNGYFMKKLPVCTRDR